MLTCYNCKTPVTLQTAHNGKPYCSQDCEDQHYNKTHKAPDLYIAVDPANGEDYSCTIQIPQPSTKP